MMMTSPRITGLASLASQSHYETWHSPVLAFLDVYH